MKPFHRILRDNNFITGTIIFDDNEIIIQRDIRAFWYNLVLAIFILVQPITVLVWGTDGYKDFSYNYQIFLFFVGGLMLFLSLFKILEIRKTNNIAFPIKDLKSITVVSRKKSRVRVSLQLSNSRKTSVTVYNDTYFRDFIDTLKRHNVEIN